MSATNAAIAALTALFVAVAGGLFRASHADPENYQSNILRQFLPKAFGALFLILFFMLGVSVGFEVEVVATRDEILLWAAIGAGLVGVLIAVAIFANELGQGKNKRKPD